MKKQHTLALLLLAGLALSACSSDDDAVQSEPQSPNEVITYHATTVASLGGGGTRALSLDGTTLNATWASGENVYVQWSPKAYPQYIYGIGSLSPTNINGATANLEGDLYYYSYMKAGDPVLLRFPREDVSYTGQLGTLEDIAARFDYAELNTTVETVDNTAKTITINGGTLENKQAIVKFTFSQAISKLDISSAALAYPVNVTPAEAATVIYVALPIKEGVSGAADYSMLATPASGKMKMTSKSYNLQNGAFYGAHLDISGWEDVYVGLQVTLNNQLVTLNFAKMNIGAASETDYGDYFAWGETSPKATYTADNYTYTDNPSTLPAAHDAATANWGSDWRMPTREEIEALVAAYPLNATSGNRRAAVDNYKGTGVNGWAFYNASDEVLLFVPKAGLRGNAESPYQNQTSYYWTSSINGDYTSYANYDENVGGLKSGTRTLGLSVRAVYVGN